jgi:raffinose/stachyose/melibiose transport system substrate-binding protein
MRRQAWRGVVAALVSAGVVIGAAGCSGGTDAGGSNDADTVTVWATSGTDKVLTQSQERWNAGGDLAKLDIQFFETDPYKSKLRTAISAGGGPTVFHNWGGGGLKTYVDAGEVASLQDAFDASPELRDRIFPSVLAGGTVDGEIYGTPYNGVQPVVIYYNTDVFTKNGVAVPATWDELLTAVAKFKAAGVTPFSIGGASRWPYLMWIAYLTDRIGGPEVFDAVVAGKDGAWENPAIIKAAAMIQDLVKAGGFGDAYSAVDANQGAAEALVYTGKAAMQLQGAWAYSGTYLTAAPDFVKNGSLGWTTFPRVAGGKGDPSNVTGNLSAYFSVTEKAPDSAKKAAKDWLVTSVFDDQYVTDLIATGAVPPISGIEDKIAASDAPVWNTFIYKTAQDAGNFQLSWDQALDADQAEALLNNLEQVFLLQITPEQFAANMSKAS